MAGGTLRSIYSAADETIAQLDQLHRASFERIQTTRLALDASVAGLGNSSLPFTELGGLDPAGGPVTETSRGRPQPVVDETPYVSLPQRTTHGGDWGPAMVAKLRAAALAKDTRW